MSRTLAFVATVAASLAIIDGPLLAIDPRRFPLFKAAGKLAVFPPHLHAAWILASLALLIAFSGFLLRLSPRRVFLLAAASFLAIFAPPLIYEFALFGPDRDVLGKANYLLPVTVFAGIWLFSALADPSLLSPEDTEPRAVTGAQVRPTGR